jgi:hypothetical protein
LENTQANESQIGALLVQIQTCAVFYNFMKKPIPKQRSITVADKLFNRVVAILDQARNNVVRAVNTNMVVAYWLIGREIVLEVQEGKGRAEYGEQVLSDLSSRLEKKYGDGFSETNLRYFRTFFKVYADRLQIQHPTGAKSSAVKIGLILCSSKSEAVAKYSVLAEHRQVFAAKYLECLPSEEDLRIEIQNERRLIEGRKV